MNRVYNQTACPCSQYSCKRNNHGYRIAIAIVPNLLSDEEYEGQKNDEHDYKKWVPNMLLTTYWIAWLPFV